MSENKYYVVTMWGDVQPMLSEPFSTEQARDEQAKIAKANDTEENGEDYSGIYWLNIVDGKPEMGAYAGYFFDNDNTSENEN